jgi:tripartite-type tricarboxylate transporter receptor subunit TctC
VRALQSPTTRAKLTQLAVDPMPMTPVEFDKRIAEEIVANEKLIKAAGIK